MPSGGTQRAHRWPAWRATVVVLLASVALGTTFDVWYRNVLVSRERERVMAYATPYASAFESAVGRRLSRLAGLRAFVESRRSVEQLYDEFPTFASGLRAGAPGIRALELVDDGRISAVVPRDSNEAVIGYDLYADSRPVIPGDVRRAIETGAVTITGPINLVQGGRGLVVRQRIVRPDSGFPDLVAMVMDLPAIIDEAAAFSRPTGLTLVVLDRKQDRITGPSTTLDDPVIVPIRVADGGWTLLVAPPNGWNAAVAADLRPTRIASAMIGMLLVWLTFLVAGSQQRLRSAVDAQTRDLRSANDALLAQVRERELAEQRLREQDERLRLALTSGHMGTWDYESASDTLRLSEGALSMLGLPDTFAISTGAALLDALPAEARETAKVAYQQALQSREFRLEHRLVRASGDDCWLYCTGEVMDAALDAVRMAGVLMDVTERRRLEEQLLHSQKMEAVGTLAGGIAHDFNNLLTAILGFARLSHQQANTLVGAAVPESVRRELVELGTDLEEIVKAGERAAMLTSQLLAFSRRQVISPARLDLNTTVHEVERMLHRLIGERIALVTACHPQSLFVRADAGQLAQVLVNLVVNARDAMPDGGTIRVSTQEVDVTDVAEPPFGGLPSGRWCVLSVRDDGVGMSPDVMSRMFEPFFTTKRVGEGTGLGLSMVYGIVTQAGGQAFVESTPGLGTTVRIALPWAQQTERHRRTPHVNLAIGSANHRILVVEDEPGLRRLVAEILSRRGFAVEVARDGIEALAKLDAGGPLPDLVLTDVVMPRMGGPALANELRRRGIEVPVLFMSGYPAGEELPLDESQRLIDKPFTPDALVAKVREGLLAFSDT